MRKYIFVREKKVIELIDEGIYISIIDLINDRYIDIGNYYTLNSAIMRIYELNIASQIMDEKYEKLMDELFN